jgi:AcrR family transcriptional regulator
MNNIIKKSQGRPRSVKSHQAILQATLELLAEVGFDRMSIEAIAARAKVGKTTIYRRYKTKEELVADAIESVREEIVIPDTGSLWGDIEAIVEKASEISLSPLGKKTVSAIVSNASSNSQFAEIYWRKYLQPRREMFAVVLERAKLRKEIQLSVDSDLVFDMMSGIMLYRLIFECSKKESWIEDIKRGLQLLLNNTSDEKK